MTTYLLFIEYCLIFFLTLFVIFIVNGRFYEFFSFTATSKGGIIISY